jgi:hypothetical protein
MTSERFTPAPWDGTVHPSAPSRASVRGGGGEDGP